MLATKRRRYQRDPVARARILAANARYAAAHPEVPTTESRTYRREYMRECRTDREWVLKISRRRREVAELKRRGLWPAVRTLPAREIVPPRRKLDRLALVALDARADRGARARRAA